MKVRMRKRKDQKALIVLIADSCCVAATNRNVKQLYYN